jgi:hypothetical protein
MEILFWIAPVMKGLTFTFCFLGALMIIGCIPSYICVHDEYTPKEVKETYRSLFKKLSIAGPTLIITGILVMPLTCPMDIYKNILIYRGVNSTLVDKTVDTAEKALQVLNLKLDEQLLEED